MSDRDAELQRKDSHQPQDPITLGSRSSLDLPNTEAVVDFTLAYTPMIRVSS